MTLKRTSNNNYSDFTYTSEVKKLLDVTLNTRDTNKLKKIYSNFYELDKETYKDAYRREFICAQRFAEFCKNEMLVDFFEQRAKKYLN